MLLRNVRNSLPDYTVSCRNPDINSMILPHRENFKAEHSFQLKKKLYLRTTGCPNKRRSYSRVVSPVSSANCRSLFVRTKPISLTSKYSSSMYKMLGLGFILKILFLWLRYQKARLSVFQKDASNVGNTTLSDNMGANLTRWNPSENCPTKTIPTALRHFLGPFCG